MGSIRRINGKITKEYAAWKAMKARCYSKCNKNLNYQIKKIKVCSEWIDNYEQFFNDMGKCPKNHSLDRIDNDGDYCKINCRWANDNIQTSNRSEFNIIINYKNKSKTLKQWSKYFNIKYTTLWLRMFRTGLKFEDAVKKDPFNKLIFYKGKYKTMKEWCIELNLPLQTMIDRKYQGWVPEEYFEIPIKKVKI